MVIAVRRMVSANVEIMSLVANVMNQNQDSMHQRFIKWQQKSKMEEHQMAMLSGSMYKKVNFQGILERDTP